MWFGRVVPLLQFPVTDRKPSFHSPGNEERTLPLPMDLCAGMATENGTALYVTYGINRQPIEEKLTGRKPTEWGDDLAGWFVISPFPPKLFASKRLKHMGVRLHNLPGAFQKAVAKPVADSKGIFLAMEVLATGDMGALVLLPGNDHSALDKTLDTLVREGEVLDAIEVRHWERGAKRLKAPEDWTINLLSQDSGIDWANDRRVIVRDRQIVIPFGEFWYKYEHKERKAEKQVEKNTVDDFHDKVVHPNYCLVSRDMDTPVLLVLVPSRPLFRIDMDIAVQDSPAWQSSDESAGVGVLNEVVKLLGDRKINIWHTQHTFRSLAFVSDNSAKDNEASHLKLRAMESRNSIVASVPKERRHDDPEAIRSFLNDLRKDVLCLRREPPDTLQKELKQALESVPKKIADEFWELLKKRDKKSSEDNEKNKANTDLHETSIRRLLRRITDNKLQPILDYFVEPPFVQKVEMHGPPLFRCFFSHSAKPIYDEREHIDRLKSILEAEVFEVVEGQFSLGMSTEELSRARIRQCDLFVSFLWPREDYRMQDGKYLPPEWITHEESFAIGQRIPVYRIIEDTVENPRYEKDRIAFKFKKGDMDTWGNLERSFRLELRELVLKILLGVNAQRSM